MNRELRYCTSADGTRIAYVTFSDHPGTPIVQVTSWVYPIEHASYQTSARAWYDRPGASLRLISYDRRGIAASQREGVSDFTLAAQVADLEAVVEHLGLDRVFLMGFMDGCAVAASYAAAHPAKVSRLALNSPLPRGADAWDPSVLAGLRQFIPANWPLAARTVGELIWSHETWAERRESVRALVGSCSASVAAAYLDFWSGYDLTGILPGIETPTLVLTVGVNARTVAGARATAALIPDARAMDFDTHGDAADAVLRFFGQGDPAAAAARRDAGLSDTAIILLTDIADSTMLNERLGDAAFHARSRELEALLDTAVRDAGGRRIEGKLLGDGMLSVFTSARRAIDAAVACRAASAETELPLHIGLHAGDIISESGNVHGGAVNIAARICDLSLPGEIMVSQTVRDLARTSADVTFDDRGAHELKGVSDSVRLFAICQQ